jgi:alpha-L-fucosidase
MDAKLGLFVYAPGFTEEEWEAHHQLHGHKPNVAPHVSGHWPQHWTARAWDRIPWDPEGFAQLAFDAGCRYVVFARTSFILNHPSKYNDVEGSAFMRMGPRDRDYIGEIARAVRARGMRFGIYTNYIHPQEHPQWIETVKEAIDKYQPSTLWFDGDKMRDTADNMRSKELLAYYYNHSEKQDEVAAEDALGSYKSATWGKRLHHGDWYRKEESPPHDEISNGYYIRYRELFYGVDSTPTREPGGLANNIIEWLIDCTAKGGGLEPAIFLGPPDHFALEKRALLGMGDWLRVNGEAIYDTRPWVDGSPQDVTAAGTHVRYTTKDDSLYAILMKWEQAGPTFPRLVAEEGATVRMLGVPMDRLEWKQSEAGLVVSRPLQDMSNGKEPNVPCDHAFVYKITPRPTWVE